jgi:hypothetical protein
MATKKTPPKPKKVSLPDVKLKKGYIFDPEKGYIKLRK